jgi:SAM-dependent methyltransferase
VAVTNLAERFPEYDFVQMDIGGATNQFAASRFDAVSIMDVLFHIVDDTSYRRAFFNLARLLKPGGFLLFTENFLHQEAHRAPHQVQRTLPEIELMLQDVGLTPVLRRPQFVLMNMPIDSRSAIHHRFWSLLTKAVRRHRAFGNILGALLYQPELALASWLREGPSTELMICRKQSA